MESVCKLSFAQKIQQVVQEDLNIYESRKMQAIFINFTPLLSKHILQTFSGDFFREL